MKKFYPYTFLALMLSFFTWNMALADENEKSLKEIREEFKEYDLNKDGKVTLKEMEKAHQKWKKEEEKEIDEAFEKGDINKDGKLSKKEFRALVKKWEKECDDEDDDDDHDDDEDDDD